MKTLVRRSARPLEVALGVVFLLGVALKAADINLFAVQVAAYGVLPGKTLLGPAALLTVGLECFLGISLILALRAGGWLYAGLIALLLVFTGLILYGWVVNDLEDCGCFGALEMSPQVSIAKNVLLLALTLMAWVGWAARHDRAAEKRRWLPRLAAALVLTLGIGGYANAHLTRIAETGDPGQFADLVIEADQGPVTLGSGDHLLALLSMDCEHCMGATPGLNNLFFDPELPPVSALCLEEQPGDMANFRAAVMPLFPMAAVEDDLLFYSLIGQSPPRIWLIRDGHGIAHWDDEAPTREQVLEALAAAPGADESGASPVN